jgi:SAM-dependent methyltransferase
MICPICGEIRQEYLFVIINFSVIRCSGCGLLMASSAQAGQDLVFDLGIIAEEQPPMIPWTNSTTEKDAASGYMELLKTKGLEKASRVLLIAEPDHALQSEAENSGWQVSSFNHLSFLKAMTNRAEFDAAVVIYQLEKSDDPGKLLNKIYSTLKPEGLLMVTIPSLDSNSARFFGRSWTEWRPENRLYFDNETLQLLLWRNHFNQLELRKDRRKYTLTHIYDRAQSYPRSWITRSIRMLYHLLPSGLRNLNLRLPSSGVIAIGMRAEINIPQVCSMVLPAFNESKTFPLLMDTLLSKKLPGGLRKEIIIVESNSNDGTREQVLKYQDHPDVKVILQDQPRGKGNAVRAGFEKASGDILLIQDADLEYDLNDLDVLLEPVVKYQAPFVLGSRHGGRWKMRQFTNEQGLSTFFNFGHQLFTSLLNIIYGQRLKDPFTMYKVFRRDCLYGLSLEANRFDFDFELVIKLVRKGYHPTEIPINYNSRSFKEGKKVRVFRDPLTWIWALIKYRFADIYKKDFQK